MSDRSEHNGNCEKISDHYEAEKLGVRIPCTICQTDRLATDMYWVGTSYCDHGVPASAIPMCPSCVFARELEVRGGAVVGIPVPKGQIEEIRRMLEAGAEVNVNIIDPQGIELADDAETVIHEMFKLSNVKRVD